VKDWGLEPLVAQGLAAISDKAAATAFLAGLEDGRSAAEQSLRSLQASVLGE
jgi:hypothetical protein